MIDSQTYARYSIPLEQQMLYISDLGVPFLSAINSAEVAGVNSEFLKDVYRLKAELDGKPGDGALEVYRDVPSNIKTAKFILDKWNSTGNQTIKNVLVEVSRTYDALVQFQRIVDETPSDVLYEIKRSIKQQRVLKKRSKMSIVKALIPFLAPVAAIIAYQHYGVGAMMAIVWGGLILYFIIK